MNIETTTEFTLPEPTTASEQATEAAPSQPRRVRWFRPPVDVFASDEAYRVDVDVPGVAADRLDLTVDGSVLTVEARRDEGRGWRRQLRLTDGIDAQRIEAHLESGVLSLVLPKAEAAKARRIQVLGR